MSALKKQRAAQLAVRRIAARSAFIFWIFARVFERTLRKNFHSIRIANRPSAAVLSSANLVVFTNHPSWWDGATLVFLADRVFGGRPVFTPIDAAMLQRYSFFGRIGAFGVEQNRALGALEFLAACRVIFADAKNILLVTAQGRFADCRERPLRLEPGVAHVSKIAPRAIYVPLAIEYTHWLEKRPELLLRFGEPISGTELQHLSTACRLQVLERSLTDAMDALARDAIARDGSCFEILVSGQRGINPIYDLWLRLSALVGKRPYSPDHGTHI